MGQLIDVIHSGQMPIGKHTVTWDASSASSGTYIIKAETASNVSTQKVMLLK